MGCTGRQLTVSLAKQSSHQMRSLLSFDARPFVSAALKGLFNQPPLAFHATQLNLEPMLGSKLYGPPRALQGLSASLAQPKFVNEGADLCGEAPACASLL
jgi:hypothetical protein